MVEAPAQTAQDAQPGGMGQRIRNFAALRAEMPFGIGADVIVAELRQKPRAAGPYSNCNGDYFKLASIFLAIAAPGPCGCNRR